ncbi:MAG: aldehyde ferredoxin oxidoreductase C-terminal domain-containing protein [Dehalococcoidia bacterium]|nr:aldehyde ferredoxin oxidoreductase C-terminal domain-containing protein [Dehalococcoidia bacterium]
MKGRGQILRIDLNTEKITKEPMSGDLCRNFVGGEGVNSWLLWQHFLKVGIGADPLGPDNVLIAGLGPLGGTCYGAGSKMKWTFKSPAYNLFGDSAVGGAFGPQMRWAGYDHMVITGRAKRPTYIWIQDDTVELRDARQLMGKDVPEVDEAIKHELGEAELDTACIGRAAENLVTFGSITVSRHRSAGRTGAGAVMASKNLKAIAARGTRGIPIYDPKGFFKAMDDLAVAMRTNQRLLDGWKLFGTLMATGVYQRTGVNAYRNNQESGMPDEKYQKLSHRFYRDRMAVSMLSCSPGCITGCDGRWKLKGDESPFARKHPGLTGNKPEYAAIGSFGAVADIPDLPAATYLGMLCTKYSMDMIEVGTICGFLMELWQKGIINADDTKEWFGEPVTLEWENYDAVEKIVQSIALQNNKLGDIFKGGLYKAAQRIEEMKNAPALKYALYGKGGAPFMEDVRHTPGWAMNMAVASRGADHLKGTGTLDKVNRPDISKHYFGRDDGAKPFDPTLKGASSALSENRCALINSLGICISLTAADPFAFSPELFARALQAATGMAYTGDDLLLAGERIVNVEKAFNSRLGCRREDDKLCERWLKEAVKTGPGKGMKAEDYFDTLKDEYYHYHGWDQKTSLQTRKKLEQLGMQEVAEVLVKEGALAE